MPTSLFTTSQSRFTLHILISLLSLGAITQSAQSARGAGLFVSRKHGDIRGPDVVMGGVGLVGCVTMRIARWILPKPWRVYLDRLEFSFVSVLWIFWTSTAMAFTAYITETSVCVSRIEELFLPTCPILTLDLTLLYLLSISTLALMLVILSTVLSPNYYTSLSPSLDGASKTSAPPDSRNDLFVMWDLALSSPRLEPVQDNLVLSNGSKGYGTTTLAIPIITSNHTNDPPSNPYAPETAILTNSNTSSSHQKRDKFSEGRVWSYVPLLICSMGVAGSAGGVFGINHFVVSNIFVISIAVFSGAFATTFLLLHRYQGSGKVDPETESYFSRHQRAIEFSLAGTLFLLWPLAGIVYTLYPSTPYRPCSQPAQSFSPEDLPGKTVCILSSAIIGLSWLSAWIVLARVLGLIFPLPDMGSLPTLPTVSSSSDAADTGETVGLLSGQSKPVKGKGKDATNVVEEGSKRPQMKWGRLVAGEAFELGDAEDDDGD